MCNIVSVCACMLLYGYMSPDRFVQVCLDTRIMSRVSERDFVASPADDRPIRSILLHARACLESGQSEVSPRLASRVATFRVSIVRDTVSEILGLCLFVCTTYVVCRCSDSCTCCGYLIWLLLTYLGIVTSITISLPCLPHS